jgi:hypothetical protein
VIHWFNALFVFSSSCTGVICPNCSVFIEYHTLTKMVPVCEKTCPQCRKEFLVVDGVGKPLKKRRRGAKV